MIVFAIMMCILEYFNATWLPTAYMIIIQVTNMFT